MDTDVETSGLPKFERFIASSGVENGNIFDATFFGKGSDIFGGPFRISIEGVDDGFPGIDIHDPGKHIGVINLDDETVENSSVKKVFGSGA